MVADDNARTRLHAFGRAHEKVLQTMGTDLATVRFTFT